MSLGQLVGSSNGIGNCWRYRRPLRRPPRLIARLHVGPPVLTRHSGAATTASPEQSRADGHRAPRSQQSCLSRMHALRGQEVQSKVSDLEGVWAARLPHSVCAGKMPASTTPRMFRSPIILCIPEQSRGTRYFLGQHAFVASRATDDRTAQAGPQQATGDMASAHSLQGLMKWLGRDEWRDAFKDVLDLHLVPACEATSMEVEEARLDPRSRAVHVERSGVAHSRIF